MSFVEELKYRFFAKSLGLFLGLFLCIEGCAQSAVLSSGSWYRINVSESRVYKIRYEELKSSGILENPIPSSQIALFGGENGALSERNISNETFDLQEIATFLADGGDGQFGAGDYLLFYGQSPNRWVWNASEKRYVHQTNVYTSTMSYFLTTDLTEGTRKRLQTKAVETNPEITITDYKEHYLYENDAYNPFRSSREWYGEKFSQSTPKRNIELILQNIITSQNVDIKARFVANESMEMLLKSGNNPTQKITINKSGTTWMRDSFHEFSWIFAGYRPTISFEYSRLSSASECWAHLDYMEIYYRRQLTFESGQIQFRFVDTNKVERGEFRVSSANSNTRVWDISNPLEPQIVQGELSAGNIFSFTTSLAQKPEFIGFTESSTNVITQFEKVKNQNLHALDSIQYAIVVHPDFISEAKRLAEFHRQRNLKVLVVTPTEVFNEFSYGRQDPMGIRRMLRHFRNKALAQDSGVLPQYLLLFGSPSYDYKNQTGLSQNFVLNYQFSTGLTENSSFSTDDMFGFLADNETGHASADVLHVGIGRFPARTLEQAKNLVNKTIAYTQPHFGDWKNVITNFADDCGTEDFARGYEQYFEATFKRFSEINVEKFYADAYPQVATPSGARFPEAKNAWIQRINRGALIVNYEGHSGERLLGDERYMETTDIRNLENTDRLNVFFAASCSYARYDDNTGLVSDGEEWVLLPNTGAVALFGTTRVAYVTDNKTFHNHFNYFALQRDNGKARTLGEILKLTKNRSGNSPNNYQQFVLLGDPALPIALPKYQVNTTHINNRSVKEGIDTLKALETVSISGNITDFDTNILSDFNGEITITVYDKPSQRQTLGSKNSTTSEYNPVFSFEVQNNALFKGKVSVVNGEFQVEFMMPKDLNYTFGNGKISYYAFSDSTDATGAFEHITIGGFGENFGQEADAPIVQLFLNDTNFRSGNITSANPILLAQINDKYGINYSGTSIGHDISLTIDGDERKQVYLNDYFAYLMGSNTRGEVYFPMFNLAPGKHNLKLKVWNIFNVSTLAEVDFEVTETSKPYIDEAYNYPNPIIASTKFYFTHNAPKKIKRMEIDIFDMSGRLVTQLGKNINPNGFAIEPIEWDATDSRGNRLRQGLYLYRIRAICDDGQVAEKTEKLVIAG